MKEEHDTTSDAAELRRSAEQRLQEQQPAGNPGPAIDTAMRKLVHELQVHQIELEMQNEELRRARAETDEALARYTDLYDFAPVGYLTLDRDGVIIQANLACAVLLGVERGKLLSQRLGSFAEGKDHPVLGNFLGQVFAGQDRKSCELALTGADDIPRQVHIEASADEPGQTCRAVLMEITERKRVEARLAEQYDEMRRWHDITMGRETRILELKHEINELLAKGGQPPRYPSAEPQAGQAGTRNAVITEREAT